MYSRVYDRVGSIVGYSRVYDRVGSIVGSMIG